jgi:hypothetical protein
MKNHLIVGVTFPIENVRYIFPHRPCDDVAIREEFGDDIYTVYQTVYEKDGEFPLNGIPYTIENIDMLRDWFYVEFQN